MATESLPTADGSATLWTKNLLWDANASLIAVGTEDEFYPASNVMDPLRFMRARPAAGGAFYFDYDLGSAQSFTGLALVGCNLAASLASAVELWANSSLASLGTTSGTYRKWTFGTDSVRPQRGVHRWFLGVDDAAQANNVAFRYVRVKIIGTKLSTDLSIELAHPWLGTYFSFPVASIDLTPRDPSQSSESFNTTPFVDSLPLKFEIAIATEMMDEATYWPLRRELIRIGGSQHMILDRYSKATDVDRKAESAFYGRLSLSGPFNETVGAPATFNINAQFVEDPF